MYASTAAEVNPNIPNHKAEESTTAVESDLGKVVVVEEQQSLPSARTESLDTPLAEEKASTSEAEATSTQEEPKTADRPLGEEEAEADEVRQELFPEAAEP